MVSRPDRPQARSCLAQVRAWATNPEESWDADAMLAWIEGIEADASALRALDAAHELGCDLEGLLYVAALLRAAPHELGQAVYSVRFGPFSVNREARLDIPRALACCDSLEAALGPDPRRGTLEALAEVDRSLQQVVDDAGGRAQTVRVLGEDGSVEERRVRFVEPAIIPTAGEIRVAAPPLDDIKKAGRTGEPRLNVVAMLVFAHLRAMRRDVTANRAADLIVNGLHSGRDTGAIDVVDAMRSRVERIWKDQPELIRTRVEMLASICRLPVALP